jgi:hypothetical protein
MNYERSEYDMAIYQIDPISDPRWAELLLRHPDASVFHSPGWLKALRDTYGYKCIALSCTPSDRPLSNGIVFAAVNSWLTGRRMVSLPFADHCQPLVDSSADLGDLLSELETRFATGGLKYIELRPLKSQDLHTLRRICFGESASFFFHTLNLLPSNDELYRGFHKSCIQRKIQRAGKEELTIEHGQNDALLTKLYSLLLMTRRRHQLPPQPIDWFRNLVRHCGEGLQIWIASKNDQPIAGMLTLAWKNTVIYKYGGSDSSFHNLGGMPALFWHAIQHAKQNNATVFDFGRSDLDNPGLIDFKGHWGTDRTELHYYRYDRRLRAEERASFGSMAARKAFAAIPDSFLTAAGRVLYRHFG